MTIALALLLLLFVILIPNTVVAVPAKKVYVVSRLGRFLRLANEGLTFKIPFVDAVTAQLPLSERVIPVPSFQAASRDGRTVHLEGRIRFKVTDPRSAACDVVDYIAALRSAAQHALSEVVGRAPALEAALAADDAEELVRRAALVWGVQVLALEPIVSLDGVDAARLQDLADRELDARILAFAAERGQGPGPDGLPTEDQEAAYQQHMEGVHRSPEYQEALQEGQAERARVGDGPATRTPSTGVAVASGVIAAGALGLVELGGRMLPARNLSPVEIPRGARCVVEREEGGTVFVRGA